MEAEQQPPPSESGKQSHPSSTNVRSPRPEGRRRLSVHWKGKGMGGVEEGVVEEEQGSGEWRGDCPSVMSCWRALCVCLYVCV